MHSYWWHNGWYIHLHFLLYDTFIDSFLREKGHSNTFSKWNIYLCSIICILRVYSVKACTHPYLCTCAFAHLYLQRDSNVYEYDKTSQSTYVTWWFMYAFIFATWKMIKSFLCATGLIHKESLICDTCTRYSDSVFNSHVVIFKISGMTYSFIRILVTHACICVPWWFVYAFISMVRCIPYLMHVCDRTLVYMWHESCTCVRWPRYAHKVLQCYNFIDAYSCTFLYYFEPIPLYI